MGEEVIENLSIKRLSILSPDGKADEKLMPTLSDDDVRTMYWYMNLSRILDNKMLALQKQGRLGTFASVHGQEGSEVALAYAIKEHENIWLCPSFRENAAVLVRGVPMDQILRYWGGYEIGSKLHKGAKILPVTIPVGSQALHADGIGLAMKIKGEKGAAISFFGDGATSEGETMEAMNFAGEFRTPTVFFCQNNQYAISTPRSKQTAAKTLAQKAYAFGFEGMQVDGNDVFAVYRAVRDAVEKALSGEGPTFIEAITYRMENHTTADDWRAYRSEEEVKQWEKKDPILRLRRYMVAKGMWNDEHERKMLEDARKKVDEAVASYENTPKPRVEEIFDYLYETLPPSLEEQKRQWIDFWGGQQ